MAGSAGRVLVTRPEPGASETAQRLKTLGFLPLKLPLHEIRPLPVDADAIPGKPGAVAVTSANAVRHAPGALLERLSSLPCFAVGETTAVTARAAGFSNVIEGEGDAEALARTIVRQRPNGDVAYLCSRVRRSTFEKLIAAEHIEIQAVETYDTISLDYSTEEVMKLTGRHPLDHVLVYSANAAEVLAATMRRQQLEDLFRDAIFACISGRVADALGGWPGDRIRIAREPDEPALLSLLGHVPGKAS